MWHTELCACRCPKALGRTEMIQNIPDSIRTLAEIFRTNNYTLYIVGGYVRNTLLGISYTDTDIDCCSATPASVVIQFALQCGFDAAVRDDVLGTLEIRTPDETIEYTQFREESYSKGKHRPQSVSFTEDIMTDAQRRDFTVNAIYIDALTGKITDPLGGRDDLEKKILRACRPEAADTLKDDGLRLMRLARFSGELGFEAEDSLLSAAKKHAYNIKDIAKERIAAEFAKICLADTKYPQLKSNVPGHYKAMSVLDKTGVLNLLIPELYEGLGIEQKKAYHRYDVFDHSLHTFENSEPVLEIRLAALLHDIAKPRSLIINKGKMYGHDILGADIASQILTRLGFGTKLTEQVCLLIRFHMYDLKGEAKISTLRMRFAEWGFDLTRKLISLRRADIIGSGIDSNDIVADKWEQVLNQMQKEGAIDDMRKLAVNGDDIIKALGIKAGEEIGRIKKALFLLVAQYPSLNTKDRLLEEARKISNQRKI